MINFIRKFFIRKPYVCCMELHNQLGCYLSLKIPSIGPIEGFRAFFWENHFLIAHRMFDPECEDEVQLEEIYKKLLFVYDFNPKDENLMIIRGERKVYIPEKNSYVPLLHDGVLIYDKSKLKVLI